MIDPRRISPRKRIAALYLHPGCDMACRFCASERGFDSMTQHQAESLVMDLARTGIESVVLGGGEPLLWSGDLGALVRCAKIHGLHVQLCTNALALPASMAALEEVDRFLLPLEAADADLHDRLREQGGPQHAMVLRRVEELTEAGRELTVSTVVTRLNADVLTLLADLLQRLHGAGARIHAWHLYRFPPVGRGGRPHADELEIELADYLAAVQSVRGAQLPFPVFRRHDMLRSSVVEHLWLEDGDVRMGSETYLRREAG